MFFKRWVLTSVIIFTLITTLSIISSIRKFSFLSPTVRLLKISGLKFWMNLIWIIVIFTLISVLSGVIILGIWEIFDYLFAEAVHGSLLYLEKIPLFNLR